jgi:hypothetical protein
MLRLNAQAYKCKISNYFHIKGEGVGKINKGISLPVKASLKFNTNGVGYNMAEQFTTNWWDHLYNSTAKKIDPNAKKSDEPKAEVNQFIRL